MGDLFKVEVRIGNVRTPEFRALLVEHSYEECWDASWTVFSEKEAVAFLLAGGHNPAINREVRDACRTIPRPLRRPMPKGKSAPRYAHREF